MAPLRPLRAVRRGAAHPAVHESAALSASNLERVLAAALDHAGPVTRAELIAATGLSAPTVGNLSACLIRRGLLRDLGTGPSSGGRRPSLMTFNDRYGFVSAIDIGPTRTRLAVADLRGMRLAHRVVTTPSSALPRAMLEQLACELRTLMDDADVPSDHLLAVGTGVPGVVDERTGRVVFAPNLAGWRDIEARGILEEACHAPVLVENDVNLAILGEHWRGAAQGHGTCAFIFVGTGIGAAVLIDGELHRGHHFMAGEIAVMCMGPQYVERDFGTHGCLETLAGLPALAARFPRAAEEDPAAWVSKLIDAAHQGHPDARAAVLETARFIGIAAANVGAVVDPSIIILGGALFAQAPPLVAAVSAVVARISRAPIRVVVSALEQEAPLWGGLLVALTAAREQIRKELGKAS